jgi:hypothetical protein
MSDNRGNMPRLGKAFLQKHEQTDSTWREALTDDQTATFPWLYGRSSASACVQQTKQRTDAQLKKNR